MIYVATVHFETDRWIDTQLAFLRRNIPEPLSVYANLENVPGDHAHKFTRVVQAAGPHSGKLNLLAAEISAAAKDDDLIVFLDGDAFPVADPLPTVYAALEETALVAVRRDENAVDIQPHPAFCAVRVHQWRSLHGDWSAGYCWRNANGAWTTDVGGNLLRALELAGARWTPLLRSNRVNPHPLWYGVYGGIVYHHGAGFRWPVGRVDLVGAPSSGGPGRKLPGVGALLRRWDSSRAQRFHRATADAARQLHAEMMARIQSDPEFYRDLI